MASDDPELALLAQVLAAPDDDTARMVLADWYLDRGDPRGEVLARPETTARQQRAMLGALYTVTTSLRWDRGLLRAFTLAEDAAAPDEIWARAAQHPWLAAVRVIERGAASLERYRGFVTSARAVHLEAAVIPDAATFDAFVAAERPRLTALVLERPTAEIAERLRARPALLPALARLTLVTHAQDITDVVACWSSFVRPGVDVVLRAPQRFDIISRAAVVAWLARDAARAGIVEYPDRTEIMLEVQLHGGEVALRMDRFVSDALDAVNELHPARLATAPLHGGHDVETSVEHFRNPVCTYAPLPAYRALLARFPPDRLRFEGAYAALAGNPGSRPA